MQIKFDISDPATIRGIIRIIGAIVAFIFLWFKSYEDAVGVMALTATLVGAVGISTVKEENKEENKDETK